MATHSSRRRTERLGLLAVLIALTCGCGRVYGYPEPEAESTLDACGDGFDNDLDGEIDCADADCAGLCPEQTAAECQDGHDNDADGFLDAADPSCWPVAPPEVERCAGGEGISIVENFDAGVHSQGPSSPWVVFGQRHLSSGGYADVVFDNLDLYGTGENQDGVAFIQGNTSMNGALDDRQLGALVRRSAFSGTWDSFELSFRAELSPEAILRAGIVPGELAPLTEPPLPAAEDALLSVTVSSGDGVLLSLTVEGETTSVEQPQCPGYCSVEVSVVLGQDGIVATMKYSSGEAVTLHADAPSELPPSRLVFWGGTSSNSMNLDDVRLRVAPELPCGEREPQIPGAACYASQRELGSILALAGAPTGERCAVVSVGEPGVSGAPQGMSAWVSSDGRVWVDQGTVVVNPPDLGSTPVSSLVGAGVARDEDGWHLAAAYYDGIKTRIDFSTSSICGYWHDLTAGPVVSFEDFEPIEPPSYVIVNGRHDVYFTRPAPEDGRRRALWRITRGGDGPWSEPSRLATLPEHVSAPVSVQSVGSRDLVLVHPTASSTGIGSLGVLVSDETGRSWQVVEPSPLLPIPIDSPLPSFDERGAIAGALSWDSEGGSLLYGGATAPVASGSGSSQASQIRVGSARLAPAGRAFPQVEPTPAPSCGDGECHSSEDCSICFEDCDCDGIILLSNPFSGDQPWSIVSSSAAFPRAFVYPDRTRDALNFSGGFDSWASLPIGRDIIGNFELSFDLRVDAIDPDDRSCSFYVGLGELSESEDAPSPAGGVFARFAYSRYCSDSYWAAPFVASPAVAASNPDEEATSAHAACAAREGYLATNTMRHFVLVRAGNHLSLTTAGDDRCKVTTASSEYTGVLTSLSELIVGFGGGAFGGCARGAGAGSIENVHLRLLSDPASCPPGTEPCAGDGEEPSCIDTLSSPESCGACGSACSENEVCEYGFCECAPSPDIIECAGRCVDARSLDHCGACGNVCGGACVAGVCENGLVGTCAWPLYLPVDYYAPERTDPGPDFELELDFSERASDVTSLCGASVRHQTVVTWQPVSSGVATIELDSTGTTLDPILGVSADPECANPLACSDDVSYLGKGSRISMEVGGYAIYHLAAGLISGDPLSGVAKLRVKVTNDGFGADAPERRPDVPPEAITWLTFDGNDLPADRGDNGALGVNGIATAYWDECAELSWDPATRCFRGSLCDPGPTWQYWGAALDIGISTTGADGAPPYLALDWNPATVGVRGLAWQTSGTPWTYGVYVHNLDPELRGQCTGSLCAIYGPAQGNRVGAFPPEISPFAGQLLFNTMLKEDWGGSGVNSTFDVRAISAVSFKLFPKAGPIDFCIDRLGMIR